MECTLCEGQASLLFPCKTHDIYRCKICRHAFSANYKVSQEEIYADEYISEDHKRYFDNPDLNMYQNIYDEIVKEFGNEATLIDIGCGSGNLLRFLRDKGMSNLAGLDLFENLDDGIEYIKADINNYEFDKKYDVITSIGSIEHVFEIHDYFEKVTHIAHPNTLFIVYTLNENSFFCRLSLFLRKMGMNGISERIYSAHHVNHFSVNSLEQIMNKHGWEIFKKKLLNFPLKATDIGSSSTRPILIPLLTIANAVSHFIGGPHTQIVYSKTEKNNSKFKLKDIAKLTDDVGARQKK